LNDSPPRRRHTPIGGGIASVGLRKAAVADLLVAAGVIL